MNTHFLAHNLKYSLLVGTLLFILLFSLTSYASENNSARSPATSSTNTGTKDSHTDKPKEIHADEHDDKHEDEHGDEDKEQHSDEHGDEAKEGHIVISADMLKTVGITSLTAMAGEIKQRLTLYGTVTTEPSAVSQVRARFPGIITTLKVNVGDKVKKGQAIAEVESNNSLMRYNIYAAISGIVTQRNANPGELADQQVLLIIEDHQQLWVELQVFSGQQSTVKIGQSVQISWEQQKTNSIISQILPSKNDSPFIIARVPLDNNQGMWSVGSLLSGSVVINKRSVPIIINNSAMQIMDDKPVIFVKNKQGFEVRTVTLGLSDDEFSQILSGLNQGEGYAVQNSYLLKAELEKSSAEHHH